MVGRRKVLNGLGAGALALAVSGLPRYRAAAQNPESADTFRNPLNIPPLEQGSLTGGFRHFELTLQRSSNVFLPDIPTETFGINGDYLGPTLLMRRDEQVAMAVHNRLQEPSSLHWHGFHVPASEDGGPNQQIEHGDTWNPAFKVMQKGGTYWYHSHVLHRAGEQVFKGLAGMILVKDQLESTLELPGAYGDRRHTSHCAGPAFRKQWQFQLHVPL